MRRTARTPWKAGSISPTALPTRFVWLRSGTTGPAIETVHRVSSFARHTRLGYLERSAKQWHRGFPRCIAQFERQLWVPSDRPAASFIKGRRAGKPALAAELLRGI